MGKDYCSYSPDLLFGADLSEACKKHDEYYVKQNISRLEADKELRDDIYREYEKQNKKIIGFIVSNLYFIGVRIFGSIWGW